VYEDLNPKIGKKFDLLKFLGFFQAFSRFFDFLNFIWTFFLNFTVFFLFRGFGLFFAPFFWIFSDFSGFFRIFPDFWHRLFGVYENFFE